MSSVSGSTVVYTEMGELTIGQIATIQQVEFNTLQEYKGPKIALENGYFVKPRFFTISKPVAHIELELTNKIKIKCLPHHKLLTDLGYMPISRISSKHCVAVVKPYFGNLCLSGNNTIPVNDITKHAEYRLNNLVWVRTAAINPSPIEPAFSFSIPYYNRFVGNGIINQG